MSETHPSVSVIVPVYNGERTIGSCIRSLLELDYPSSKLEIIIVDNNSKDGTGRILREFPVVSMLEDRIQSSYAARNAGIGRAGGRVLAFTDSDCIVDKEWIAKAVDRMGDPRVGCVAGRIEGYSPSNYIEEYLIKTGCLTQGSTMFLPYAQTANAVYRREVFDVIGRFEEHWKSGGDADLTWRMQLHSAYKFVQCDDALVYHVHRSTLKGFFRQRMTWGNGEVLMHKKYKGHLKTSKGDVAKEIMKDYKDLVRLVAKGLPSMAYRGLVSRGREPLDDRQLTMVAAVGRRLGRIRGSLQEREFYI